MNEEISKCNELKMFKYLILGITQYMNEHFQRYIFLCLNVIRPWIFRTLGELILLDNQFFSKKLGIYSFKYPNIFIFKLDILTLIYKCNAISTKVPKGFFLKEL